MPDLLSIGLKHWLPLRAPHAILATCLLLACSACGGVQLPASQAAVVPEMTEGDAPLPVLAALPPLPLDKTGSATSVELVQDGNDCVSRDQTGYTTDDGTFASFAPAAGAPAWAMYSFYCGSHATTGIAITPQPGSKGIYVGYSDYSTGRWKFAGPFSAPAQPAPADDISIALDSAVLSPQGNVHVLIAVAGDGASAVVERLRLGVANWHDGQMNLGATDIWDFSLMEIGGRPAIAYVNGSGQLKFIRAAVTDGSTWEAPINVASGPFGSLRSVSLAQIAGRPAIALYRPTATASSLQFIRALDANGSNWPAMTQTVVSHASDDYVGLSPSLISINGYTAIAYCGADKTLGYALNNADASGPWLPVTIVDDDLGADYLTLQAINDHPAICYIGSDVPLGSKDILYYAYSSSINGVNSQDWTVVTVDETNSALGTGWSDLQWINDSFPAVIYPSGSGGKFKYAYATSADGLSGWTKQEVDPTAGDMACGLVTDNGRPAIFYRDFAVGTGFMRALDETGTDWAAPVIIAPTSTGLYATGVIDGRPAIALTANTNPSILAYTYRP